MPAQIRSSIAAKPTVDNASRDDLAPGDVITLEVVPPVVGTTFQWTLVFVPEGSTATLTPAAAASTAGPVTFTADLVGPYLVRLTVDAGLPTEDTQYVRLRALTATLGLKLVAAGERRDSTGVIPVDVSSEGWANEQNDNLLSLEAAIGAATAPTTTRMRKQLAGEVDFIGFATPIPNLNGVSALPGAGVILWPRVAGDVWAEFDTTGPPIDLEEEGRYDAAAFTRLPGPAGDNNMQASNVLGVGGSAMIRSYRFAPLDRALRVYAEFTSADWVGEPIVLGLCTSDFLIGSSQVLGKAPQSFQTGGIGYYASGDVKVAGVSIEDVVAGAGTVWPLLNNNDVLSILIDLEPLAGPAPLTATFRLYFGINGAWLNGADPATKTGGIDLIAASVGMNPEDILYLAASVDDSAASTATITVKTAPGPDPTVNWTYDTSPFVPDADVPVGSPLTIPWYDNKAADNGVGSIFTLFPLLFNGAAATGPIDVENLIVTENGRMGNPWGLPIATVGVLGRTLAVVTTGAWDGGDLILTVTRTDTGAVEDITYTPPPTGLLDPKDVPVNNVLRVRTSVQPTQGTLSIVYGSGWCPANVIEGVGYNDSLGVQLAPVLQTPLAVYGTSQNYGGFTDEAQISAANPAVFDLSTMAYPPSTRTNIDGRSEPLTIVYRGGGFEYEITWVPV